MKLASRHDIAAPAWFVHGVLTDFARWERVAMRRGAEVVRADRPKLGGKPGDDPVWQVRFMFRGKERKITLRVGDIAPPDRLGWSWVGQLFQGWGSIELIALGPRSTRLTFVSEVKARGLAGRLLLQSARLVQGRIQRRLDARMAEAAADIEAQFRDERRNRAAI